jgi:ethanolamine utilization protein EutL
VIGIIAGPSPAEVNSGLSVITQVIEEEARSQPLLLAVVQSDKQSLHLQEYSLVQIKSYPFLIGALLTGSQSACKAACSAFEQVIQNIADNPLSY